MNLPEIFVPESDYERMKRAVCSHYSEEFFQEIERANIISDYEVPPELVTLDSYVRYLNETDNVEKESFIVLAGVPEGQDSVLSVYDGLGTALLGLKVGDRITWATPSGEKTLRILEIKYQPEAAGD